MKEPKNFASMAELRVGIDALDEQLVELLAYRTQLIARAAELKQVEHMPARINWRVEDVVSKVKAKAAIAGMDVGLAERLWREMIDHFIAQEEQVLGKED